MVREQPRRAVRDSRKKLTGPENSADALKLLFSFAGVGGLAEHFRLLLAELHLQLRQNLHAELVLKLQGLASFLNVVVVGSNQVLEVPAEELGQGRLRLGRPGTPAAAAVLVGRLLSIQGSMVPDAYQVVGGSPPQST